MADFTHTITVSASLDSGKSITLSFVGTIEDVYAVQRVSGQSALFYLQEGGIPEFNMPTAFSLAQCIDGVTQMNVNTSADSAPLVCFPSSTVAFHGPKGAEVDTSNLATTNANLVTAIDFTNGSGKFEFIALKTPVS